MTNKCQSYSFYWLDATHTLNTVHQGAIDSIYLFTLAIIHWTIAKYKKVLNFAVFCFVVLIADGEMNELYCRSNSS